MIFKKKNTINEMFTFEFNESSALNIIIFFRIISIKTKAYPLGNEKGTGRRNQSP